MARAKEVPERGVVAEEEVVVAVLAVEVVVEGAVKGVPGWVSVARGS